jgi:acyl-coenzyme A synthetase/AMP-(fatty) acid ligase
VSAFSSFAVHWLVCDVLSLADGVSTFIFESTPVYPNASRYWEAVQKHKITQFVSGILAVQARNLSM